jgi:O-antigen/teichoic acid export membrane protein
MPACSVDTLKERMLSVPTKQVMPPIDHSRAVSNVADAISAAGLPEKGPQDRHLSTDHLLTNLKSHTVSSGVITGASQGAKFALNLAYNMVLARLLDPKDFGLVAMVTAWTGVLRVFKDAGLSTATVQREGVTHAQVSNLFWINVVVSGLMSLLVAAAALPISMFYHDTRLIGIALVLSTTFLFSGTAVQHVALLNRQMRFKMVALVEVGSMTASLVVGIVMAWTGCRYWAVVGGMITLEVAALVLTWSVSGWRPQRFQRNQGTRPLLAFGANLTAGNFVGFLVSGLDVVLIGKFYGPDPVGLYTRAQALLMRPFDQLLGPMSTVFLPTLSRLAPQPERYRNAFLRVYDAIVLLSLFSTAIILPLARPLTLVLLGPKWEQAAAIFAGFTIAALYLPVAMVARWLLTSQGRGRDVLIFNLLVSGVTVAAFVVGLPWGPVGVAVSFSISGLLLRMPIGYYIAGRSGPVRTKELWMVFLRHLPLWIFVFLLTWLTNHAVTGMAPLLQLLLCAPAGLLGGAAYIYLCPPQRRAVDHLFKALGELKKRNQGKEPA